MSVETRHPKTPTLVTLSDALIALAMGGLIVSWISIVRDVFNRKPETFLSLFALFLYPVLLWRLAQMFSKRWKGRGQSQ